MSIHRTLLLAGSASLSLVPAAAWAQEDIAQVTSQEPEAGDGDEILVVADRLRGQVDVPQPPVAVLNEADIAAYGAGSIADLVSALSIQTGSGRGRGGGQPVFLVNGLRVSSFRELRSYPPEALAKIEILPEEVAQKYGFAPDQRVMNFILKKNFSSRQVEGEYSQPAMGGYHRTQLQGSLLRINGPSRLNISLEANDTSPMTEAVRGLVQAPGSVSQVVGDPDPAAFRTLIADGRDLSGTVNWTTGIGSSGGSLSLNGTASRSDRLSLFGLDAVVLTDPGGDSALRTLGADDPLAQRTDTTSFSGGSTINAPIGGWQFTGTLDAGRSSTTSETERRADVSGLVADALAGSLAIDGPLPGLPDAGFDTAETIASNANAKLTLMGQALALPAGDLSVTMDAGHDWNRIDSSDTGSISGPVQLTRGNLNGGVNLTIPLTSRSYDAWGWAGDLSLNLSAGVDHLSDFGTLYDWSAGLIWGLTEKLSIQTSYVGREAAPSLAQLGNPQVITLNVPMFDFARAESVLVATTSGGNPLLLRETQRDLRVGATWQLPMAGNSSLMVEYVRNRSRDVSASFPLLTPDIESAFPGRVTRDTSGRLVAIDQRPVSFAQQNSSRLRFGFNLSGALGKAVPQPPRGDGAGGPPVGTPPAGGPPFGGLPSGGMRPGGMPPGGPPMGGRPQGGPGAGRGPGGPGGFGGDDGRGRWFASLNYTLELSNEVLIAPGLPMLDLLDGDALSGSGVTRHAAQLNGGMFYRGFGTRLSIDFSGPSRIDGSGLPGSTDLFFGSLARFDWRLFADIGQMKGIKDKVPLLDGVRVALRVDNLFDGRRKLTDSNGDTPLRYQPFLLDPTGRYLGIELRKVF